MPDLFRTPESDEPEAVSRTREKYNGKIQEKKEKTGKFGLTVILSRQVIL